MAGPLAGYRVLDLSRILAGPWLAQLLSDLGAEVWKIERPGTGDEHGNGAPRSLKDGGIERHNRKRIFPQRQPRQAFDMRRHRDRRRQRNRARAGATSRHRDRELQGRRHGPIRAGLRGARKLKPDIVYCSITGYGQTGPMKDVAGYDMAIQATGGLMSITGESDDMPGGGPQKVGVPIVDILTGMYSATGVISALLHRERTGEGQHIDMALLDVQVAVLANQNMNYLTTGTPPKRYGNAHPNIVPYQVFKTRDGSFVLAVGNDQQFRKFCAASGLTELATDSPLPHEHRPALQSRPTHSPDGCASCKADDTPLDINA